METYEAEIPPVGLPGSLCIPDGAMGLVAFAHGSGSSRSSPRNVAVARGLNDRGIATLLFDLLTPAEEDDRANVFNIALLAQRLIDAIRWADTQPRLARLPLGLFGASTGAAAALVAAARLPSRVAAVVSRGGRPDLAGGALAEVRAPTLLIVGGNDVGVIELNEEAYARLASVKKLEIVSAASHLFPEPGAMKAVTEHAGRWFVEHLAQASRQPTKLPTDLHGSG
jgi:pimeloyl-ACP methyl ester carboxylesterase